MEQSHASVPMPTSPPLDKADTTAEELSPTYAETRWGGLAHYTCLLDGYECWHLETLTAHMTRYHEGAMRAAPAGPGPEAPAPAAVDASQEPAGHEAETTEAEPAALQEAPATDEGA